MRRGSLVLVLALAFAGSARAAPPSVDARAYTVVNASNGTVLASSNAHEQLPIASITKLMTVIVALQHLRSDDDVTVTAKAARVGEERIPLRAGQVLPPTLLPPARPATTCRSSVWAHVVVRLSRPGRSCASSPPAGRWSSAWSRPRR